MTDGIANLTSMQKDQLLQFFFYHMPFEQRERLMAELPRAYNAACGRQVVKVVNVAHASDGSDGTVHAGLDKCETLKGQDYNA